MAAARQPRPKRINYELWLTVSAVVISVCALVVSVVQTRIAREQQTASVWPYLQIREEPMDDNLTVYLDNNGVGPAVVQQMDFFFRQKRYEYLPGLIAVNIDDKHRTAFFQAAKDSDQLTPGDVLKAGSTLTVYQIMKADSSIQPIRQILRDSTFRVEIRYRDVYGNCWQLSHRWRKNTVAELGRCGD